MLLVNSYCYVAFRYDPFGTLIAKRGTAQPFGFSTKRTDQATGLVYFGARWYAPHLGRWMTKDPLGETGGLNLYAYVFNNPINWIDPYGEEVEIMIKIRINRNRVKKVIPIVESVVGKVWNSPNTAVGIVWGGLGCLWGLIFVWLIMQ